MELLLTSPVSPASIVLGKFLGGFLTVLVPLGLTVWYPLALAAVAGPEVGPLLAAWLGLVLAAATFTAVGLLTSSLSSSSPLAFFLSFGILAGLSIFGGLAASSPTNLAALVAAASPLRRLEPLLSGVIDTGAVVFFLATTAGALFLTERLLESRRWR